MKIGLAQINTTIGDFEGNRDRILSAYREAVGKGAELVITPELCVTGYPPQDMIFRSGFVERNLEICDELEAAIGEVPLLVGCIARNAQDTGKPWHNAAALLRRGEERVVFHKTRLPTYDVFDELRYFEPSDRVAPVAVGGMRAGVTICEDVWSEDYLPSRLYDRDPADRLKKAGMDVLLNLSASPFSAGKPSDRYEMLRALAGRVEAPVVYCNAVGGNDQLVFDGGSLVVNAAGEVLLQMRNFEEEVAVVDLHAGSAGTGYAARAEEEDIFEALTLGVRDYMGKCGFKSATIGLSGGIDSALTAAVAANAVGPENVYGVTMPSVYSSEGSVSDAEALAKNLGLHFDEVPIQTVFEALKNQMEPVFGDRPEDVTEENMQARIRGTIMMSMANKFGHLLLTTGNKSELAVGYCTIYGDMCGGLAVISDVPKVKVYAVSRWLNREREVIPWNTIEKPPSAELRPDQKDQDTLPEYDVLDAILELYVEQARSVKEIVEAGFEEDLVKWIRHKVDLNEWKRQQAAPGIRVTSKAFGFGRRYPIAQRYRN